MKGVTESGFAWEIEDEALDDYELLEVLHKIDTGEYGMLPEMVDKLLGKEQTKMLKSHIRTEGGRVSATRMITEVMDIFKSSSQGKNC